MTAVADIWDVLVVGAGPAGSSLAARLGCLGRSVLLLDSARFPREKMCGEYLGPGCLPLLDQIGALPEVLRQAHPGRVMKACSPGGFVFRARYPEGLYGLSLRRRQLDGILLDCARRHKSVEVREGFRAEKLVVENGQVSGVKGRRPGGEEETLRARLTIGADGRNSMIARRLGVFRWHPSHRRFAVGLHYEGVQPSGEDVEVYSGRALYAILNNQGAGVVNVNIVWKGTSLGAYKGKLDAWYEFLLAQLPRLRERLGSARMVEAPRVLGPLAHYATRVSANGALLVGDSACFYDPFTGEGMHMALDSARLAAEVADRALEACTLSRHFLSRYDAARAASLTGRYRLQSLIQVIVGRPRLSDYVAQILQARERLADRLMEVIGGLRPPGDLLAAGVFLARPQTQKNRR